MLCPSSLQVTRSTTQLLPKAPIKTPEELRRGTSVKGCLAEKELVKHFPLQSTWPMFPNSTSQRILKAAINSPHFNRPERKITINVGTKLWNLHSSPASSQKLPAGKGRGLQPRGRSSELSSHSIFIRILSVECPKATGTSPDINGMGDFQMLKGTFVRERTQAFFFFHFPPPRSSVSVELSSTSALDHLEIASICGHRKECIHWLPEKEAPGSLSFLPENVPWAADSHRVFELRETRGSISNNPPP